MRKLIWSGLLVALATLPGACAATVGTVVGPVTGPVTYWNNTYGMGPWKTILLPFVIPLGPLLGLVQGARADVGYLANGEYGVDQAPPFEIIFDPTNTALTSPH